MAALYINLYREKSRGNFTNDFLPQKSKRGSPQFCFFTGIWRRPQNQEQAVPARINQCLVSHEIDSAVTRFSGCFIKTHPLPGTIHLELLFDAFSSVISHRVQCHPLNREDLMLSAGF
jgi:hypothetical protein